LPFALLSGQSEHERKRSVEAKQGLIVEPSNGSAETIPAQRHNLIDHDLRKGAQTVLWRRLDRQPNERRIM
jgi:hypothetical protein